MLQLQRHLYQASQEMAAVPLSFRRQPPMLERTAGARPTAPCLLHRERFLTWPEPDVQPRLSWRCLPSPSYQLHDSLWYKFEATAGIAHCPLLMQLLGTKWGQQGWEERVEDACTRIPPDHGIPLQPSTGTIARNCTPTSTTNMLCVVVVLVS